MSHERDPIKVYDARWEAGEYDDREIARLFEAALEYGRELGADTVTLCRDARLAAGRVQGIGVEVALRQGYRVFLRADPISTPQSYFTTLFAAQRHPAILGLTVTASHNPASYVGLKFTVPPVQAIGLDCGPAGGLRRVRELYHADARYEERPGGELHVLDLSREYLDFAMARAGLSPGELRGLRVILDSFNGSAGPELHALLERAGVEVEAHRLVPDGNFPTGSPNPTSHQKMDAACSRAGEAGVEAVIGVDGDGDRIVFGDRRGLLTAGFASIPILETSGLARREEPVRVLYDPKVSPLALARWGHLGVEPRLFRNGHSQIKDYMSRIGAEFCAEESGHYYHRLRLGDVTVSGECSALTILLFLRMIHRDPAMMDELWRQQAGVFTTGEFNYQFEDDATRDAAMEAVIESFEERGASTTTATPEGVDLQGTILRRGITLAERVQLEPDWFSGYLRVATNERSVARSYFSCGDSRLGREIEAQARAILAESFGGRVID